MTRRWRDMRARWEADPAFQAAYAKEYPYAAQADRLVGIRADLGLTDVQFARRLRVPVRLLRAWESGTVPVPDWSYR